MERVKKGGGNLTNGFWGEKLGSVDDETVVQAKLETEMARTNPLIRRQISLDEFKGHASDPQPWFSLNGEVYDGTNFLSAHPGGAVSITGAAGTDATEEFMAIRKLIYFL